MFGNDRAVYETVKPSTPVFPHTANPAFALLDLAPMAAKITEYTVSGQWLIKHGFFHNLTPDPVCSRVNERR